MRKPFLLSFIVAYAGLSGSAADPFEGLTERKVDCAIVRKLQADRQSVTSDVLPLFQELTEVQRRDHALTLISVGCEQYRTTSEIAQQAAFQRNLIYVLGELNLIRDSAIAKALFMFKPYQNSSYSLFGDLFYSKDFPLEELSSFFPVDTPERNRAHMVRFLNHVYHNLSTSTCQRILALCNKIGFEDWDSVDCAVRWQVHGTADAVKVVGLKSFFKQHEIDFQEQLNEGMGRHRSEAFKQLMFNANAQSLLAIARYLGENPYLWQNDRIDLTGSGEIIGDCIKAAVFRSSEPIPVDVQLCVNYICACVLPYAASMDTLSFDRVQKFMQPCALIPENMLLTVCSALYNDPRYDEFLTYSHEALEAYMEKYPAMRESIVNSESKIRLSEEYIKSEMRLRMKYIGYIQRILGTHPSFKTLFSMLLDHCKEDLCSNREDNA